MEEVILADLCEQVNYGYTASAEKDYVGPKFLRITDIQGGTVNWSDVPHCKIEDELIPKYSLAEGDIVVARTGNSTGENFIFTGSEKAVFASYLIRFRIDKSKADPAFVWYNMRSAFWWDFVNSVKSGSAQPGANAQELGRFKLILPPLKQQKAISNLLKKIDDKIELNNQINETLESIAKAIFKEWFIDFGPVKAKAEGKKAFGMDDEIAALFPDSFEESELGLIPKAWKAGRYCDIFSERSERIGKIDSNVTVLSAVATSELVPSSEHFSKKVFSEDISKYKKVFKNDFAYNPSRINIGSIGRLNHDYIGAVSPIYLVVTPKEHFCNFNLLHLRMPQTVEFIKQYSSGSVRQALTITHFLDLPAVVPPMSILEKFNIIYEQLSSNILALKVETKTLTNARDLILPKLISGEIELKD